ncbi:uncharacterized protein LOC114287787 [Camellia sinensis]|uniref:uncharacterized protein LOC114287787 n=1 Tax=Camellia sinensis TaxID=4442 RepID=UPI0010367537|nr:uncharacterized protein LOC114287787 [Camellia sinensis]
MKWSLFLSILYDIHQFNEYFIQTYDATGALELFGVQKMTVALRILQYSVPVDAVDKYIRIGETIAIVALNFFTKMIVAIYEGRALSTTYTINNHAYTMGYYLTDGIYPRWAMIVKTISQPQGLKRQLFARMHEACQKDVERSLEVLQVHFNIVRVLTRGWSDKDLYYIMKMCIIFHNMIIEDVRNIPENECSATLLQTDTTNTLCQMSCDPNQEYEEFMLNC